MITKIDVISEKINVVPWRKIHIIRGIASNKLPKWNEDANKTRISILMPMEQQRGWERHSLISLFKADGINSS